MSQEEKDLATHVEICAIRYKGIQEKFDGVESRLSRLETEVASIKVATQAGFSEIKLLISAQNNAKVVQWIAAIGTIGAALLGCIGYIIVKL